MADPGEIGSWVQWLIGIWAVVSGGIFTHIYMAIEKLQERMETRSSNELDKIWKELGELRRGIEGDRQRSNDDRARLAASIVTREEFERQITRLIDTVERQLENRKDRNP